jgi:hypothetical protein
MSDKPSKSESDRLLYEYQRQLDAPKIFSEKYPNISAAVAPTILHKDDRDIYNTLGKNTQERVNPFSWHQTAEENATGAMAKDFYKTTTPDELIEKLKNEDDIDYSLGEIKDPKYSGQFDAVENQMSINYDINNKNPNSLLDTIIHEHGHAKDFNKNPNRYRTIQPNEFTDTTALTNQLQKDKNLYDLSGEITKNHFIRPKSHSINTFIDKAEALGKEQGLVRMPDNDPKYNELGYIKPTLKKLQQYPTEKQTLFEKLKALLNK